MDTHTSPPRCILWASPASERDNVERAIERDLRDAHQAVRRLKGEVVDTLTLQWIARWATSFEALRDEALANGYDAYLSLETHWLARDFDVLIAWDVRRLTRSSAVYNEMLLRTFGCGARLHLMLPNCAVDAKSYRARPDEIVAVKQVYRQPPDPVAGK